MSTQGFGRRGAPRKPPMANRKRPESTPDESSSGRKGAGASGTTQIVLCAVGAIGLAVAVVGAVNMTMLGGGSQPSAPAPLTIRPAAVEQAPRQAVAIAAPAQAQAPAAAAGNERLEQAVSAFFGFYHVNARARVEHCAKHGVDINSFAARFRSKNSGIYERAIVAAQRSGLTEDRIWNLSRLNLASLVATDMAGAQDRLKSGPDGACKAMNEYAEQFVNNLDFKAIQPEAHRVLTGS